MDFSHLPSSKPTPRRPKSPPVFCVGWRAFIHWPQAAGQASRPVPMIDGTGKALPNDLVDGQEVEILSWRPRAREGVTYQIRRMTDGTEWLIPVDYLRRTRDPVATTAADEAKVAEG
jgi:hypothetical protein